MDLDLGRIGQIALGVSDVEASERFYEETLGLRKAFKPHPGMVFFDCGGQSLLLERFHEPTPIGGAVLYFDVADIALSVKVLKERGLAFEHPVHLITRQPAYDLYMAFFRDPDGHLLALQQRAPKGYEPPQA